MEKTLKNGDVIKGDYRLPSLLIGLKPVDVNEREGVYEIYQVQKLIDRLEDQYNNDFANQIENNALKYKNSPSTITLDDSCAFINEEAFREVLNIEFIIFGPDQKFKNEAELIKAQKEIDKKYVEEEKHYHTNVYTQNVDTYTSFNELEDCDFHWFDVEDEDTNKLNPFVLIEEHVVQDEYSPELNCYIDSQTDSRDLIKINSIESANEYINGLETYEDPIVWAPNMAHILTKLQDVYKNALKYIYRNYDRIVIANALFESSDQNELIDMAVRHEIIEKTDNHYDMLVDIATSDLSNTHLELLIIFVDEVINSLEVELD